MSGQMKVVTYRCTKCGAEDTPRFFPNEIPFMAINCYKCHAGMHTPLAEMLQEQIGIFPVTKPRLVD